MKLQRYNVWVDTDGANTVDDESPRGEYYRAADVLAWRDSIRAAVEYVVSVAPDWWVDYDYEQGDECRSCGASRDKSGKRCEAQDIAHRDGCQRAALDALLADGGV